MKSIFKKYLLATAFLLSFKAQGRDIIVITYDKDHTRAQKTKKYIASKHLIPSELIALIWRARPCDPLKNSIYHICLKNDGGFSFPVLKQKILVRSFSIFKESVTSEKIIEKEGPK